MSCPSTQGCQSDAASIAAVYRQEGVAVRFVLETLVAGDLLAGVPPTAEVEKWDAWAIVREVTVQERALLQMTSAACSLSFAHPSAGDCPAGILAFLLRPLPVKGLSIYVAADGELGDPPDDVTKSVLYRFHGVKSRSMLRGPVAHCWIVTRSGE